jgi:hypothetical protein
MVECLKRSRNNLVFRSVNSWIRIDWILFNKACEGHNIKDKKEQPEKLKSGESNIL